MLSSQRSKTLLYLKVFIRIQPPTPNLNPIFPNFLSTFSPNYSTISSDKYSFTVSYLINNCGFSPEIAHNVSKEVRFNTAKKPDSVIAFFRNHGFSSSQINSIIRREPHMLVCNPHKRVLSKFEFLRSKGASSSDIVLLVTKCARFLYSSLENNIIPKYELVRRFFHSDKKAIDCIMVCPFFFSSGRLIKNVKMLCDEGVTDSNIGYLFSTRPSVLLSRDLRKAVNEVKELGFDPCKTYFFVALLAKTVVLKPHWNAKVDNFKSWGWSEQAISDAFRRDPHCMLASKDKINAMMRFWVNQLGWNSYDLVMYPVLFGYSLEKRIIPRASVVQYLLAKGLRNKKASLLTPFSISEELFLEKYVKCFKEETSQLLTLYQEKMNLQDNREDGNI